MNKNTIEHAKCQQADSSAATAIFAKLLKNIKSIYTHIHMHVHPLLLISAHHSTHTHTHGYAVVHIQHEACIQCKFVNEGPLVIRSPMCNDA